MPKPKRLRASAGLSTGADEADKREGMKHKINQVQTYLDDELHTKFSTYAVERAGGNHSLALRLLIKDALCTSQQHSLQTTTSTPCSKSEQGLMSRDDL